MKKIALITGASSGIGRSIAEHLAGTHALVLCGRRKARLEKLADDLRRFTDVHILAFDLRNKKNVAEAIASLPTHFRSIGVLVNNAGNAHGFAPIDQGLLKDFDAMIESNVQGMLYVTHEVLPALKKQQDAIVVNISSIAGKETYANGAVYCASKSAVEALSRGMRLDLLPFGIRVCNIAPGAVETEFSIVRFKGDEKRAKEVYEGFNPLTAQDVARAVQFVLDQPPHVQIADMTMLPAAQASATIIRKET